jgi:hypothetical protein
MIVTSLSTSLDTIAYTRSYPDISRFKCFCLDCTCLNLRVQMEQFSRECLEIDIEDHTATKSSPSASITPVPTQVPTPARTSSSSSDLHAQTHDRISEVRGRLRESASVPSHLSPHTPEQRPRPVHTKSTSNILSSTMDKVYSRAAKLIQRTLDVEGVIVMDVSHCEVFEPASALGSSPSGTEQNSPKLADSKPLAGPSMEKGHTRSNSRSSPGNATAAAAAAAAGTVSLTMHYGDPDAEVQSKTLCAEDYVKFLDFFAKHPNGHVFEGVVPMGFRMFMPARIKYALS